VKLRDALWSAYVAITLLVILACLTWTVVFLIHALFVHAVITVLVFVAVIALDSRLRAWRWRKYKATVKQRVTDDVLGILTFCDEDWQATVTVGGRNVTFHVFGDREPEPGQVGQARRFVRTFPELESRVRAFLVSESERDPDRPAKIRELAIESIVLRSSFEAMIYFAPFDTRLWRCELVHGEPRDLGCDT
jgi:hypothetical protein